MKITRVAPVGTRPTDVFVHGEVRRLNEQVFPPSPQGDAIRSARKAACVGLREAAELLEMTPGQLSAVETGCAAFAESSDFDLSIRRLAERIPAA